MIDLIVFRVLNNRYAIKIENIQRIIQAVELTTIPNAHPLIDGMMSYEDGVLKVVSFRKMIGLETYPEELASLFEKLKDAHISWVNSLEESLKRGTEFTKTTNPHLCELGAWIDSFTSYEDRVTVVFNELMEYHKKLHNAGTEVLDLYKKDQESALSFFESEIQEIYTKTLSALDVFVEELDAVANSMQKLLVYEHEGKIFAIKVDAIEDIAHIEEGEIMSASEQEHSSEFLELRGVLDVDGVLINVINNVNMPK